MDQLAAISPGRLNLPRLESNEIQLLRFAVDDWTIALNDFNKLLSEAELDRRESFRFARHADAFVIRRGLLRTLLGKYTSIAPESCQIRAADNGKPFVPDETIRFSLSHSEGSILFAFANDVEVGVDVEQRTSLYDINATARLVFSDDEYARFRLLDESKQQRAFYRVWTRKEALVKALGTGLTLPVADITVSLESPGEIIALPERFGNIHRWSLFDGELDESACVCVACPSKNHRLRLV